MSKMPAQPLRIESLLKSDAIKKRFEELLGKRTPQFMMSIVTTTKANKMLSQAEPMSIISAALVAASMDLPIAPGLGFAYIVPYRQKDGIIAQFQLGWKGYVQLAMRSGQYQTMNATPILEGQLKTHNPFTGDMVFQAEATSEKTVGYLLYFKLLNGFEKYFYMTREQSETHGKKYSKSFNSGQWANDFDAMALKTVVKQGLSKYGILSVEMQHAVVMDQAVITAPDAEPLYIDNQDLADTEEEPELPAKVAPSRLEKAISATTKGTSRPPPTPEDEELDRIASLVDQQSGGSVGDQPSDPPLPPTQVSSNL